jgi:hypothetical protein
MTPQKRYTFRFITKYSEIRQPRSNSIGMYVFTCIFVISQLVVIVYICFRKNSRIRKSLGLSKMNYVQFFGLADMAEPNIGFRLCISLVPPNLAQRTWRN